MRLTSWNTKGLDWGSQTEVLALQTRITNMLGKKVGLTNVVQIMLFRRILPCQRWTQYMWEFDPASPRILQWFFGTKHKDMWKLLFKTQKTWPETSEDLSHDCTHATTPVCFSIALLCNSKEHTKLSILPTGLDEEG